MDGMTSLSTYKVYIYIYMEREREREGGGVGRQTWDNGCRQSPNTAEVQCCAKHDTDNKTAISVQFFGVCISALTKIIREENRTIFKQTIVLR